MSDSLPLLAKSIDQNQLTDDMAATLPGHLKAVLAAADALVRQTGSDQLSAVGLLPDAWLSRLERVVRIAAALHDLGKANEHFQRMVSRRSRERQGLRHEWVVFWLCQQSPWREWGPRIAGSDEDWHIAIWAITGHHPAYGRHSPPKVKPDGCTDNELTVLVTHPDFRSCVEWLEATFAPGLLPAAISDTDPVVSLIGPAGSVFSDLNPKTSWKLWSRLDRDRDSRRFVAVVKACLLAADVAGSYAGQRSDHLLRSNLDRTPHENAPDEVTSNAVLHVDNLVAKLADSPSPADLEQLVKDRLDGQAERPFQSDVASGTQRVTLLKAGCGSGKTAAAYLWAARCWPGRRLYFCYPTTGTATEGFRDYLFDDEAKTEKYGSRLFHSRAAVDADLILHVDHEPDDEADPEERRLRADALSAWSTPIVCCTVDRVLCLMQNQRQGLMSWPAFAQAAFVFDEIHTYDNSLYGLLLRFLQECQGVPVLLMTASLPESRRAAILKALQHFNPGHRDDEELREISGPGDLEQLPRYHQIQSQSVERLVCDEVARGGRVLWVCNTVNRAMDAADRLRTLELDPMIYHSRFKYRDRVAQHNRVIAAFNPDSDAVINNAGAVAVCTQVAEVSLDLKAATLLVTDLCPVPSLIQRLGRLNRSAQPAESGNESPPTRPFHVVEPLDSRGEFYSLPYKQDAKQYGDWPEQARAWLQQLGNGPLSQSDLATAWQSDADSGIPMVAKCCWFDGGPETQVDAVREGAHGVTVLMNSDNDAVTSRKRRLAILNQVQNRQHDSLRKIKSWQQLLKEFALPMTTMPGKKRPVRSRNGFPVIQDELIVYDPMRGAKWA